MRCAHLFKGSVDWKLSMKIPNMTELSECAGTERKVTNQMVIKKDTMWNILQNSGILIWCHNFLKINILLRGRPNNKELSMLFHSAHIPKHQNQCQYWNQNDKL